MHSISSRLAEETLVRITKGEENDINNKKSKRKVM